MKKLVMGLGFEERSLGTLQDLVARNDIAEVVLVEQDTVGVPPDLDFQFREAMRGRALGMAANAGLTVTLRPRGTVPPYAPAPVRDFFRDIIRSEESGVESFGLRPDLVFDLSGLTRVQVCALAEVVAESKHARVTIAYTSPANYRISDRKWGGGFFKDLLTVKLSRHAEPLRLGYARGVALLGHSPRRTLAALADFQPAAGVAVIATSEDRPDWGWICRNRNESLLERLRGSRMPDFGVTGGRRPDDGWQVGEVELASYVELSALVSKQVDMARQDSAPVFLFPYGPKVHCFVSAYELSRLRPDGAWYVYAVPSEYDVTSLDGIGATLYFQIDNGSISPEPVLIGLPSDRRSV